MTEKITPLFIKNIKKAGKYDDGNGLRLYVKKSLNKSWVFRFSIHGKRHEMGIGAFPDISLKDARNKAHDFRVMIDKGLNPIKQRKTDKEIKASEERKIPTFEEYSIQYIDQHKPEWKNKKHIYQWSQSLNTYAYPTIGSLPVNEIETSHITTLLQKIWLTKTETATRVRMRIENILDSAKVDNFRNGDNPARWKGHLDKVLSKPEKIKNVVHHKALPYSDLPDLILKLQPKPSLSAKALLLTILTATRTNEVLGAKWEEIDYKNECWTIPPERMKAKKEHRIPLVKSAISLLKSLPITNDYIFYGKIYNKPLSNMAMIKVLRTTTGEKFTVHGMRSTFRDWCAEQTSFPREIAEKALAHTLGNETERAYQRGDLLERRRKLMEAWSQYCFSGEQQNNVTSIFKGNSK